MTECPLKLAVLLQIVDDYENMGADDDSDVISGMIALRVWLSALPAALEAERRAAELAMAERCRQAIVAAGEYEAAFAIQSIITDLRAST